jgi:hypothetical protein
MLLHLFGNRPPPLQLIELDDAQNIAGVPPHIEGLTRIGYNGEPYAPLCLDAKLRHSGEVQMPHDRKRRAKSTGRKHFEELGYEFWRPFGAAFVIHLRTPRVFFEDFRKTLRAFQRFRRPRGIWNIRETAVIAKRC